MRHQSKTSCEKFYSSCLGSDVILRAKFKPLSKYERGAGEKLQLSLKDKLEFFARSSLIRARVTGYERVLVARAMKALRSAPESFGGLCRLLRGAGQSGEAKECRAKGSNLLINRCLPPSRGNEIRIC